MYSKRTGIVEPVFGNIRYAKRLDHFTLRGKIKVTVQWMLYALVHNIEKIRNAMPAYPKGKLPRRMVRPRLAYGYG